MLNLREMYEVIGAYDTGGCWNPFVLFSRTAARERDLFDTDSVIFYQPSGESWPIETGDKLGEMQDKQKPSEHIIESTSGGQKIMHTG